MKLRNAFTMIELIFVIVVMGIIGSFGAEFLAQSYNSFIFSKINNTLQSNSATAVEFIASRLQHRIKDSVIARTGDGVAPVALGSAGGESYVILEWISTDIDGFRGATQPYWSGIIDLGAPSASATRLVSPGTDTDQIDALIFKLSHETKGIDDAALYFIGSNSDINDFGWNATTAITDQTFIMHPIDADDTTGALDDFKSSTGTNFSGDIYEYYKLAWTANAIVYTPGTDNMGTLTYWYNYQPWNGTANNNYTDGDHAIIMEGVDTFQFMGIGSIIKIQVCTKSNLITEETYSLCKEKTIF